MCMHSAPAVGKCRVQWIGFPFKWSKEMKMVFIAQTAIGTAVICLAVRTLALGRNSLYVRLSMVIGVLALSAIGAGSLVKGW